MPETLAARLGLGGGSPPPILERGRGMGGDEPRDFANTLWPKITDAELSANRKAFLNQVDAATDEIKAQTEQLNQRWRRLADGQR